MPPASSARGSRRPPTRHRCGTGASRLLKKGVGGVASAAGLDARSRDEGDAGAHRRGAATPQTAPRRRNRLRWLAFCSRRFSREKSSLREVFLASRVAKGQTRHPHPFFSSLLDADNALFTDGSTARSSRRPRRSRPVRRSSRGSVSSSVESSRGTQSRRGQRSADQRAPVRRRRDAA
jgi:hypothetical protein